MDEYNFKAMNNVLLSPQDNDNTTNLIQKSLSGKIIIISTANKEQHVSSCDEAEKEEENMEEEDKVVEEDKEEEDGQ